MNIDQAVVAVLVVASAILLISFWRQILFVLLFGVVLIFCFGVYSVATVLGS